MGLDLNYLPPNLGQINYKASLLHLQPRQMRLEITDLKEDEVPANDSVSDLDGWLDDSSDDCLSESEFPSVPRDFVSDNDEDDGKGKPACYSELISLVGTSSFAKKKKSRSTLTTN